MNTIPYFFDIDECSDETDDSSQTCINTEGGFNCGCNSGLYWMLMGLLVMVCIQIYAYMTGTENQSYFSD